MGQSSRWTRAAIKAAVVAIAVSVRSFYLVSSGQNPDAAPVSALLVFVVMLAIFTPFMWVFTRSDERISEDEAKSHWLTRNDQNH